MEYKWVSVVLFDDGVLSTCFAQTRSQARFDLKLARHLDKMHEIAYTSVIKCDENGFAVKLPIKKVD